MFWVLASKGVPDHDGFSIYPDDKTMVDLLTCASAFVAPPSREVECYLFFQVQV